MFQLDPHGSGMQQVTAIRGDRSEFPATLFDEPAPTSTQPDLNLPAVQLATFNIQASFHDLLNLQATALVEDIIDIYMQTRNPGIEVRVVYAGYVKTYSPTVKGPSWVFARDLVEKWKQGV